MNRFILETSLFMTILQKVAVYLLGLTRTKGNICTGAKES